MREKNAIFWILNIFGDLSAADADLSPLKECPVLRLNKKHAKKLPTRFSETHAALREFLPGKKRQVWAALGLVFRRISRRHQPIFWKILRKSHTLREIISHRISRGRCLGPFSWGSYGSDKSPTL